MPDDSRVLVVDEDRDILDLTRTFLEGLEPAITTATARGGPAALDRFAAEAFDALVSESLRPEMSGLALAAAVHDRGLDLPFVLFTAADDPDTDAALDAFTLDASTLDASTLDAFVLEGHGVERYEEITGEMLEAVESALTPPRRAAGSSTPGPARSARPSPPRCPAIGGPGPSGRVSP
jgi:CheY-like chemotaxis protein